jgi:hypothetical protein
MVEVHEALRGEKHRKKEVNIDTFTHLDNIYDYASIKRNILLIEKRHRVKVLMPLSIDDNTKILECDKKVETHQGMMNSDSIYKENDHDIDDCLYVFVETILSLGEFVTHEMKGIMHLINNKNSRKKIICKNSEESTHMKLNPMKKKKFTKYNLHEKMKLKGIVE